MNEFTQGWLGTMALIPSVAFSIMSWIGGRPNGRLIKRFFAPIALSILIISLSLLAHTFSWWFLLIIPGYMIPLGYGGDTLWQKLLRRSLWSLVRTAPSIIFAIVAGKWTLFILQLIVGLIVTLVLGILNPLKAPQEEGIINLMSVIFVPYMVI